MGGVCQKRRPPRTNPNLDVASWLNHHKGALLWCATRSACHRVRLFGLGGGEKNKYWSRIVLICLVYCTVSASRENSIDICSLAEGQRVASLLLRNPARALVPGSDWNTGGVKGGFCVRIDPPWNKVSNGPPWNRQGLLPSMSPLALNHRRPPPTNPGAEIPGFVDLSLLIDTKWSVSLLMNLWSPVVTIYFIPNNFFQTVLPCLSLCLTWVLIKGPVMCLKCRQPAPHPPPIPPPTPPDRTQSKGRQVVSLSSSPPGPAGLPYLQGSWSFLENWFADCVSFDLFKVNLSFYFTSPPSPPW